MNCETDRLFLSFGKDHMCTCEFDIGIQREIHVASRT